MIHSKYKVCTIAVFLSILSVNAKAKCDPESITDSRLFQFSRDLSSSATAIIQASLSSPADVDTVSELGRISRMLRREISASQHAWRLHQRMVHPTDRDLLRESFIYHVGNLKIEVDDSLSTLNTSIGAIRSAGIAALAVRMSDQVKELKKYVKDCGP
ncbi:hypothetical protein [Pseudoduganella lutea]|uniref:Uncharacterized protein n=1 Tax=Pseudoduganella lutea TaxID=321985 RepID=A0A4V0Z3M1_9BURK|nr:hypothetical protein [Pseudoduganella lutea]QBE63923.1 hypothetical protein EWM63_13765 [Pseudoduganella lutea]